MLGRPYEITVAQELLDDLQERLEQTRWADDVKNVGWNYGTDPQYLQELVSYWQDSFDWRMAETGLNEFRHFTLETGDTSLHFIHEKSDKAGATPLLLLHGWPDSFYRFYKVIPKLKGEYDLVIPSLPGFGFSERKAMSSDAAAELVAGLMNELGYQTFAVAGGDIGSVVARALAVTHPKSVSAIHLTDVGFPTGQEDPSKMSDAEREFAGFIQRWWYTEGAYAMIQGTKPQTVAQALNDSPAGLAGWIIEKFYTWSGCKTNEDLESRFSKDELLTNVMIYWVTQTANTAARTYLENTRATYTTPVDLDPPCVARFLRLSPAIQPMRRYRESGQNEK
jgi:pimeloyl-ACP methyl ester carboxylesterase